MRKTKIRGEALLAIAMLCAVTQAEGSVSPLALDALQFGVLADGASDDGAAIQQMLDVAQTSSVPVVLRFPANKIIHVASGLERYVFNMDRIRNLTIDGGGSTFLVQKDLRFMSATACTNLVIRNLNVDVRPSPVVEAVVLQLSEDRQTLTVQLDQPERAGELGGPTRQDGEQDFFGMLWLPGRYGDLSYHYYVEDVASASGDALRSGKIQVRGKESIPRPYAEQIIPGETRISLPVPGVAHRHGPGPMLRIDRCANVEMTDVEVWSAPWFAFQVSRNSGDVTFRRVHIRSEPGSGRMTSSWRDGFHVKGNTGSLLFEDCILEGMNDDAFNVSTHTWAVSKVFAPNHAQIRQVFPIQFMPVQEGGELMILSADGSRRLEPARITEIRGMPGDEIYTPIEGSLEARRVPALEVLFDHPVEGLEPGCVLWDKTTANPHTVIRGCRIRNSCRLQSSVTVENCDVDALLYFSCNQLEGPVPENIVVRNCILKQGRGNDQYAVVFHGWHGGHAPEKLPGDAGFPMRNIVFENNTVYGGLKIDGAFGVQLRHTRFPDGLHGSGIVNSRDVIVEDNQPPVGSAFVH